MKLPTDSAVNPKLLIALAALVVAALLFVFVVNPVFLSGDDSAGDPVVLPVPAAPDRDTAGPDGEPDTDDEDVADSLEVFNARDPFQQLVTTEAGAP